MNRVYTAEEQAALKARGDQLLQARRNRLSDAGSAPAPAAVTAITSAPAAPPSSTTAPPTKLHPNPQGHSPSHNGVVAAPPPVDAEKIKQDLIEQFNAHMAECEAANHHYWQETTARHQSELQQLGAEVERLQAALAEQQQAHAQQLAAATAEATSRTDAEVLHVCALQQELDALTAERDELQHTVEQQDGLLGRLRQQVAELQVAVSAVENLQIDLQRAQGEARAAQEALDQERQHAAALQQQLQQLEQQQRQQHPPQLVNSTANPFQGGSPTDDHSLQQMLAASRAECAQLRAQIHEMEVAAVAEEDQQERAVEREELELLTAAQQRIEELQRENDLLHERARLQLLQDQDHAGPTATAAHTAAANPFASAEDPFGADAAPAVHAGAHGSDAVLREELAAARAECARLTAQLEDMAAATGSPTAEQDLQQLLAASRAECAQLRAQIHEMEVAAVAEEDQQERAVEREELELLTAAQQRIEELQRENDLLHERARLQLLQGQDHAGPTATAAHTAAANPFASAEDPFGADAAPAAHAGAHGSDAVLREELAAARAECARLTAQLEDMAAATGSPTAEQDLQQMLAASRAECAQLRAQIHEMEVAAVAEEDQQERAVEREELELLTAAQQRIEELQRENDLLHERARLQLLQDQDHAGPTATAAHTAAAAANPFASAEDPFGADAAPAVHAGAHGSDAVLREELAAARAECARLTAQLEDMAAATGSPTAEQDLQQLLAASRAECAQLRAQIHEMEVAAVAEEDQQERAVEREELELLTAAQQRIEELQRENDLLHERARLQLLQGQDHAGPTATAAHTAAAAANPFASAEDPFGADAAPAAHAGAHGSDAVLREELAAARAECARLTAQLEDMAAATGSPTAEQDLQQMLAASRAECAQLRAQIHEMEVAAVAEEDQQERAVEREELELLTAAQQRIEELQRENDLLHERARLQLLQGQDHAGPTATAAHTAAAAANPFASAEDPFGADAAPAAHAGAHGSDAVLREELAAARAECARLTAQLEDMAAATGSPTAEQDLQQMLAASRAECAQLRAQIHEMEVAAVAEEDQQERAVEREELELLTAAQQRIEELQRENDLLHERARLQLLQGQDHAGPTATAAHTAAAAANPFASAEDPFGADAAPAAHAGAHGSDAVLREELAAARAECARLTAQLEDMAAATGSPTAEQDLQQMLAASRAECAQLRAQIHEMEVAAVAEEDQQERAVEREELELLTAAQQRIEELQRENDLLHERARLQLLQGQDHAGPTATAAHTAAANPFASAEDPFGADAAPAAHAGAHGSDAVLREELAAARAECARLTMQLEEHDGLVEEVAELRREVQVMRAGKAALEAAELESAAEVSVETRVSPQRSVTTVTPQRAPPDSPGMVGIGRCFAEAQRRVQESKEEIRELRRRLGEDNILSEEEEPLANPFVVAAEAVAPQPLLPEALLEEEALAEDAVDAADAYGKERGTPVPEVPQDMAAVAAVRTPVARRLQKPPVSPLPSLEPFTAPATATGSSADTEEVVDVEGTASTSTRVHERTQTIALAVERTATSGATLEEHAASTGAEEMAELGRHYAEAQHRLVRSEEGLGELEEDNARLRRRVEELEALLGGAAPPASAPALQQRVEALEDELLAVEDRHEEELEQFVAQARAKLEQTEGLCGERIAELEAQLEQADVAHEEELLELAQRVQAQADEHDRLLHDRLSEQERYYLDLLSQQQAQLEAESQQQQQHLQAQLHQLQEQVQLLQQQQPQEVPAQPARDNHAEARDDWKQQHDQLQQRFSQLQQEYEAYMLDTAAAARAPAVDPAAGQEHERLTRELRDRLRDMEQQVAALHEAGEQRAAELAATRTQLQEARQEAAAARGQLEKKRQEAAQLLASHDELSELLQHGATSVQTALHEREAEVAQLAQQLEESKLQLAGREDRLAGLEAAAEAQRQREEELHGRLVGCEGQLREVQQQLRETQHELAAQQRQAAQQAERAARELAAQQAGRQQEAARAETARREEVGALQAELDQRRAELEVAQTVAATLPLEGQKAENQLRGLRQQLTEALQQNNQLQHELREARTLVRQQLSAVQGAEDPAETRDARIAALLERHGQLEDQLRVAAEERGALLREKDALAVEAESAARVAQVREQAAQRLEREVALLRQQLVATKDDLAQRAQEDRVTRLLAEQLQEQNNALTLTLADYQEALQEESGRAAASAQAAALWEAKAASITRAVEEYLRECLHGYGALLQLAVRERQRLDQRCDLIERKTEEAMADGERQMATYLQSLQAANEEQQELREIIARLEDDLLEATKTMDAAAAETQKARGELAQVRQQSHEAVFQAQRDLQAAQLQLAEALQSVSLLQADVASRQALLERQRAQYEGRVREQQADMEALRAAQAAAEAARQEGRDREGESRLELQQRAEAATAARDEALQENATLRAQQERLRARLSQLEEERAQRNAELLDTTHQLSALSQKATTEEEVGKRHMTELQLTVQQLTADNATLQKSYATSEALVDRLKAQLSQVSQEQLCATQRNGQLEAEVATLTRRLNELETTLGAQLGEAQTQLRDADRRTRGLEQRNQSLQESQAAAQERLRGLQAELAGLEDAHRQLTEAHEGLTQQHAREGSTLRGRVAVLEKELRTAEEALVRATAAGDDARRDVQNLEKEVARLQRHLDDTNKLNDGLNRELREAAAAQQQQQEASNALSAATAKELQESRRRAAEAQARLQELEIDHTALQSEAKRLREEVDALRAAETRAQEQLQKARFEKQEVSDLLQEQLAQLYEELRQRQASAQGLATQRDQQQDAIAALRAEAAELTARQRAAQHEVETTKETAAADRERHRRERYELQSKLNAATDAAKEAALQLEQQQQRLQGRVDTYEVAEQALRQEVEDLRRDVRRLEKELAAAGQTQVATDTQRQQQELTAQRTAEELQRLRAQVAQQAADLAALRTALEAAQLAAEQARRECASHLAGERTRWDAQQQTLAATLEGGLRQERQAANDARAALERALQQLAEKQRLLEQQEGERYQLRDRLRDASREVELLRHDRQLLQAVAAQVAQDVGLYYPEEGDRVPDTQTVLSRLGERLQVYTLRAGALDLEDTHLSELRRALDQHQQLLQTVLDLGGGDLAAIALPGYSAAAADTSPSPTTAAAAATGVEAVASALASPVCRPLLQQLRRAAGTFGHRVDEHLYTVQQTLQLILQEAASASPHATPSHAPRPTPNRKSELAVTQLRVQVEAVIAALHHRTAALTQVLQRLVDLSTNNNNGTDINMSINTSSIGGATPARRGVGSGNLSSNNNTNTNNNNNNNNNHVLTVLQEAVRLFDSAESFVLKPYNELIG